MDPTAEMLVEDERQLGRYSVTVVRRGDVGWAVTAPALNIVTTNYRLILWPQAEQLYPPASIPCTFIRQAGDVVTDLGRVLRLRLDTGHRIYLLMGDDGRLLRADIRQMVRPPRTHLAFAANVARNEIKRLIAYFGGDNARA